MMLEQRFLSSRIILLQEAASGDNAATSWSFEGALRFPRRMQAPGVRGARLSKASGPRLVDLCNTKLTRTHSKYPILHFLYSIPSPRRTLAGAHTPGACPLNSAEILGRRNVSGWQRAL